MVNENGRFTKPSENLEGEKAEKAWKKYDNDLFHVHFPVVLRLPTSFVLYNVLDGGQVLDAQRAHVFPKPGRFLLHGTSVYRSVI